MPDKEANAMPTLPARYEKLYKSTYLKTQIADIGMWSLIPGVSADINSSAGAKRMAANAPLFSFIDCYTATWQTRFIRRGSVIENGGRRILRIGRENALWRICTVTPSPAYRQGEMSVGFFALSR